MLRKGRILLRIEKISGNLFVRVISSALIIASFVYIGISIRRITPNIGQFSFDRTIIPAAVISTLVMVLSQLLAAVLLVLCSRLLSIEVESGLAVFSVLRSQIAKYLPGNIFHVGGSMAILSRNGISIPEASLSIGMQYFSLVIGALLGGGAVLVSSQLYYWFVPFIMLFVMVIVSTAVGHAAEIPFLARIIPLQIDFKKQNIRYAILITLSVIVFLIFSTVPLLLLASMINADIQGSFFDIFAAFSWSWVAGMVVVGSPGGLGVREASFQLLTGSILSDADALLLISLHRLLWVVSDVLVFFIAPLFIRDRKERNT